MGLRQIFAVDGSLEHLLLVARNVAKGSDLDQRITNVVINGDYELKPGGNDRWFNGFTWIKAEIVMDVPRSSVLIDTLVSNTRRTFAEAAEAVKGYNGIIEACSILIRQSQNKFSAESSSGRVPV